MGKILSAIFQGVAGFFSGLRVAPPGSGPVIDPSIQNPGGPEIRTDVRYEAGPRIDLSSGKVEFGPSWETGPRIKL